MHTLLTFCLARLDGLFALRTLRSWRSVTLVFVLLLSACTSNVRTTVSTFRSPSSLPESTSIKILPDTSAPEAVDSLEFDYYRDLLAVRLKAEGYTVVASDADSSLIAFLNYSNLRQQKDDRHGSSYINGSFMMNRGPGGVLFVDDANRDRFEYVRRIKISIFTQGESSTEKSDALLSMSAVSLGQCQHLVSVFEDMLIAMFADTQRANGSVETVPVKSSRTCAE